MRISLSKALKKMGYEDECKLYSEINSYSQQTYEKNFSPTKLIEDINMEVVTKIAPICLALIMLGLGLGLSAKDFTRILSAPKDFFVGFFSQFVETIN